MRIDYFFIVAGESAAWLGATIRVGMSLLMCVGSPIVAIDRHSAAPLLAIPAMFVLGLAIEIAGKALERAGIAIQRKINR